MSYDVFERRRLEIVKSCPERRFLLPQANCSQLRGLEYPPLPGQVNGFDPDKSLKPFKKMYWYVIREALLNYCGVIKNPTKHERIHGAEEAENWFLSDEFFLEPIRRIRRWRPAKRRGKQIGYWEIHGGVSFVAACHVVGISPSRFRERVLSMDKRIILGALIGASRGRRRKNNESGVCYWNQTATDQDVCLQIA